MITSHPHTGSNGIGIAFQNPVGVIGRINTIPYILGFYHRDIFFVCVPEGVKIPLLIQIPKAISLPLAIGQIRTVQSRSLICQPYQYLYFIRSLPIYCREHGQHHPHG